MKFQKYSTKAAVEAHVKEIVNFVDGYYRELDIRVILSHIEVWNNGDRSLVSNDAEAVCILFPFSRCDLLNCVQCNIKYARKVRNVILVCTNAVSTQQV